MKKLMLSLAVAFPLLAQDSIAPNADGCVVTTAQCEQVTLGQLKQGDCIGSNNAFLDSVRLSLPKETIVTATLRAIDPTFSNVRFVAVSPSGDGTLAPGFFGGAFSEISVATGSTAGYWTFGVSSEDVFSRGRYAIEFSCSKDTEPNEPAGCVEQRISCGQRSVARMDANACRLTDNRAAHYYAIYAQAGEFVGLTMTATFNPVFALYDAATSAKLVNSSGISQSKSVLNATIPKSGWYFVIATTSSPPESGAYTLELACPQTSGCLHPLFYDEIQDVTASFNATPQISLPVHYIGEAPRFDLFVSDPTFLFVKSFTSATVALPPVGKSASYFVRATNPCGFHNSNIFTVGPESSSKRRGVRK